MLRYDAETRLPSLPICPLTPISALPQRSVHLHLQSNQIFQSKEIRASAIKAAAALISQSCLLKGAQAHSKGEDGNDSMTYLHGQ